MTNGKEKNVMLKQILKMIEKSKLGVNEIALGAGVESRWLRYVADGSIKEPGFSKLEKVKTFLEKQK